MKIKTDWLKLLAIVIVLCQPIGVLIWFDYVYSRDAFPDSMPDDFNFEASLWSDTLIIDTYSGLCIKLVSLDSDTVINLHLTREQKESIYDAIKSVDIYKYPDHYAPVSKKHSLQNHAFSIKTTINGYDHSINWIENTSSETQDARKLMRLFDFISDQVVNNNDIENSWKEEFMARLNN